MSWKPNGKSFLYVSSLSHVRMAYEFANHYEKRINPDQENKMKLYIDSTFYEVNYITDF